MITIEIKQEISKETLNSISSEKLEDLIINKIIEDFSNKLKENIDNFDFISSEIDEKNGSICFKTEMYLDSIDNVKSKIHEVVENLKNRDFENYEIEEILSPLYK